jgi:hypothetical protein
VLLLAVAGRECLGSDAGKRALAPACPAACSLRNPAFKVLHTFWIVSQPPAPALRAVCGPCTDGSWQYVSLCPGRLRYCLPATMNNQEMQAAAWMMLGSLGSTGLPRCACVPADQRAEPSFEGLK